MQGSGPVSGPVRDLADLAGERERGVHRDLCDLGRRAGVEIRIEPFELRVASGGRAGKGGLCRIDGRAVVLVDARLGLVDQIGVLGEALGALGLVDAAPPDLRPYLQTGHGAVRGLVRPKPLARGRLRPLRRVP